MRLRLLAALAVTAVAVSACGKVKDRDEKVVFVHDANAQVSSSELDASLDQLRQIIQLYFRGDGITQDALTNLLTRFRPQLARFLQGSKLSLNDLIDLLFKLDGNQDGKLKPSEVVASLLARIPILRWIPSNAESVGFDDLVGKIGQEYPNSISSGREGLARVLLRFDEPWAGGNGDGRLTREELATAGLLLGVLDSTDFTRALAAPAGASKEQQLATEQIRHKLNQQIFGRYAVNAADQLDPVDAKLEWMQWSLRAYLADQLTHYLTSGCEGEGCRASLPAAKQAEAVATLGSVQGARVDALLQLFDHKVMGGNGDGKLATLELFALVSDLNYAGKAFAATSGDFTAAGINRMRWKRHFLGDLMLLFPRTGQGLVMGDRDDWERDHWAIRSTFWDGLKLFDAPAYGGNGDTRLDVAEFAMALSYCRIIENIYAIYDTNGDHLLSKDESRALFNDLGIRDERIVDGFFADLGLDGSNVGFWDKLRAFFSGATDIKYLPPFEFYVRLVKVMPRVLKKG